LDSEEGIRLVYEFEIVAQLVLSLAERYGSCGYVDGGLVIVTVCYRPAVNQQLSVRYFLPLEPEHLSLSQVQQHQLITLNLKVLHHSQQLSHFIDLTNLALGLQQPALPKDDLQLVMLSLVRELREEAVVDEELVLDRCVIGGGGELEGYVPVYAFVGLEGRGRSCRSDQQVPGAIQ
jgi:hypothetical protein